MIIKSPEDMGLFYLTKSTNTLYFIKQILTTMKYMHTPGNNFFVCSEVKDRKLYFYMSPSNGIMISNPDDQLDEAFYNHMKIKWAAEEHALSGKEAQWAQKIADHLYSFQISREITPTEYNPDQVLTDNGAIKRPALT